MSLPLSLSPTWKVMVYFFPLSAFIAFLKRNVYSTNLSATKGNRWQITLDFISIISAISFSPYGKLKMGRNHNSCSTIVNELQFESRLWNNNNPEDSRFWKPLTIDLVMAWFLIRINSTSTNALSTLLAQKHIVCIQSWPRRHTRTLTKICNAAPCCTAVQRCRCRKTDGKRWTPR